MASHRRPKQPSRARVTVLTATAAAAVALTSQAAHADPKPTKSEVKAKVDKLYHEAYAAWRKEFNPWDNPKSSVAVFSRILELRDTPAKG